MSSHGRRGEGFLWGLFYEHTNPYNHLPKAPPTNALSNGIRFQQTNLRWIHSAHNEVLLLFLWFKKKWRLKKQCIFRASLVVQCLRLSTSTAGSMSWIPGLETKILQVMWCSQKKKKFMYLFQSHMINGFIKLGLCGNSWPWKPNDLTKAYCTYCVCLFSLMVHIPCGLAGARLHSLTKRTKMTDALQPCISITWNSFPWKQR